MFLSASLCLHGKIRRTVHKMSDHLMLRSSCVTPALPHSIPVGAGWRPVPGGAGEIFVMGDRVLLKGGPSPS